MITILTRLMQAGAKRPSQRPQRQITPKTMALALLVGSARRLFRDFSARMRDRKDLHYSIAPVNSLNSGLRVLVADRRQTVKPHVVVGADGRFADSRAAWTGTLHCAE